jgi:hypothetical protein
MHAHKYAHPKSIVCVALFLAATMVFYGCSFFAVATPATPQDQAIERVRNATVLYTVAVTTFNDLVASGRIDRAKAAEIEAIRVRVWDHLSVARLEAESGAPADAETQLRLFTEDLNAFNDIILDAVSPGPPPGHPEG